MVSDSISDYLHSGFVWLVLDSVWSHTLKELKILYDDYLQKYKWICPECEGGNLVRDALILILQTGMYFECTHCGCKVRDCDIIRELKDED